MLKVSDVTTAVTGASKVTHILVGIVAAAAAFVATPAGHALVSQYPALAVVSTAVAIIASLYKNPK